MTGRARPSSSNHHGELVLQFTVPTHPLRDAVHGSGTKMIAADRTLQNLIACLTGKVGRSHDWHRLLTAAATTLTIGNLAAAMLGADPPLDSRPQ